MEEINNVASFSIFSIFENLNKLDFNLDDFEHNSELKDLSERLGATIIEAMFFSLIFRLSINDDNDISISDLAVVLKTNNLAVYKHFNILLSLEKKKLIRIERGKSQRDIKICIPQNVFSLIVSGVDSLKREDKGFTFSNVSQQIHLRLIDKCRFL